MAIYGINFNGVGIPAEKLGSQIRVSKKVGADQHKVRLQGLCNTPEEKDQMVVQADNGHRFIFVEGPIIVNSEVLYAIYTD